MELADAVAAEPADLLVDVVAHLVGVGHVVVDLYVGGAHRLHDGHVLPRIQPGLNAQDHPGFLGLRGHLAEPFNHHLLPLRVVFDIAQVKEGYQHHLHPQGFGHIDAVAHPLLRPEVGFIGHVVKLAKADAPDLYLVLLYRRFIGFLHLLAAQVHVILYCA